MRSSKNIDAHLTIERLIFPVTCDIMCATQNQISMNRPKRRSVVSYPIKDTIRCISATPKQPNSAYFESCAISICSTSLQGPGRKQVRDLPEKLSFGVFFPSNRILAKGALPLWTPRPPATNFYRKTTFKTSYRKI